MKFLNKTEYNLSSVDRAVHPPKNFETRQNVFSFYMHNEPRFQVLVMINTVV